MLDSTPAVPSRWGKVSGYSRQLTESQRQVSDRTVTHLAVLIDIAELVHTVVQALVLLTRHDGRHTSHVSLEGGDHGWVLPTVFDLKEPCISQQSACRLGDTHRCHFEAELVPHAVRAGDMELPSAIVASNNRTARHTAENTFLKQCWSATPSCSGT